MKREIEIDSDYTEITNFYIKNSKEDYLKFSVSRGDKVKQNTTL